MPALTLDATEIPAVYHRFSEAMGAQHWRKQAKKLRDEFKRNSLLRQYLLSEYDLLFQLDMLGELCQHGMHVPARRVSFLYPAACLALQLLTMMEEQGESAAMQLRQRFYGAVKNPADMRGLQLELAAATHFTTLGKKISWPETTGIGTFDLLVEGNGHPSLEVECKSIGEDKGRKLHGRDVVDFVSLLKDPLHDVLKSMPGGLAVVVTLPTKLPTAYKERCALAKSVARAILSGENCTLEGGSVVRMTNFDIGALGAPPWSQTDELRRTFDQLTSTKNRSALIMATKAGGALALALQSQQDDSMLEYTYETLSKAAQKQVTGTRPAMLIARFEGLPPQAMHALAENDGNAANAPSALQITASRFLASASRPHVIGVGFLSQDAMQEVESGVVKTYGTAYFFANPRSPYWSESFDNMFGWSGSVNQNEHKAA